jgi:hypothetical protein
MPVLCRHLVRFFFGAVSRCQVNRSCIRLLPLERVRDTLHSQFHERGLESLVPCRASTPGREEDDRQS